MPARDQTDEQDEWGWNDGDPADGPSGFTAPLYTADVGRAEQGRPIRVVTRPFAFGLDGPDDPVRVIVPAGFCSDGASVPRPLEGVISNWGRFAQAAIVHDLVYATWLFDRPVADGLFKDAMLVLARNIETDRPSGWRRASLTLAFWAVRAFGNGGYLNGRAHYDDMAERARRRALTHDPDLAPKIITRWQHLCDAQCIDEATIAEVNLRR